MVKRFPKKVFKEWLEEYESHIPLIHQTGLIETDCAKWGFKKAMEMKNK